MIPEFRYRGLEKSHRYRLDFMVTNPYTLNRYGFELSPWSNHGKRTGTKGKTQKDINLEAQANFEKEAKKLRAYFKTHGVYTQVFTDEQLTDCPKLFNDEIRPLLDVEAPAIQLSFQILEEFGE